MRDELFRKQGFRLPIGKTLRQYLRFIAVTRRGRDRNALDHATFARAVKWMRPGMRAEVQRIVTAVLNVWRDEPGAETAILV